jgi:predicted nucleic acid-binding protein
LVARDARTEPVAVCLDADVVIAGLFSRAGASHAILVLGEVGLLRIVLPAAVVEETRRNLQRKLPEALPSFETFLASPLIETFHPTPRHVKLAHRLAHEKDVPIMATAIGAGAGILVTHNTKHFESGEGVRVVRPRTLITEARAWMARFGR